MQAMEQKRCLRAVLFCEKGAYLGLRCIMFIRWEVDENADFNKGPLCAAGDD